MTISRERKIYGIVLGLAVAAFVADRMVFEVPLSAPASASADQLIESSSKSDSASPQVKPESLKRRIDSFRDRVPKVSENAFVIRREQSGSSVETRQVADAVVHESLVAPTYTLRAVGGVGTDHAFAQVNGVLLKPGVTDESGMTLVSLNRQDAGTGETFTALVRTAEGREIALRMAIGDTD